MISKRALWVGVLMIMGQGAAAVAQNEPSAADRIVADIRKVELPQIDLNRRDDRAYLLEYFRARQEAVGQRAELIGQLFAADPSHAELTVLLPERWMALGANSTKKEEIGKELDTILAGPKDNKLFAEAAYFKTILTIRSNQGDGPAALAAVDELLRIVPKDERGPMLLYQVAEGFELPPAQKTAIYDRIEKEFPDSRAANEIKVARRQSDSVGKPFELTFQEAITGKTISMADLKGQVVVVDFWATWCGPCVAEMPTMKRLYAEYKPKGVEFIGVSLDSPEDEGGLKALKDFVAKNEIAWPQYYQGNGWESEFSSSWGINAIPAVFVVDQQGKLYSTDARGKLEQIIPELLSRAGEGGSR